MRLKFYLRMAICCVPALAAQCALRAVHAQAVQPVIMEYTAKASGKLLLTNNTTQPLVVVLEPMSFSISPNGHGTFRTLDAGIHVELSTMSVKLQPQETYYVFYKASAASLPAWFTIYATFSPVHHSSEVTVRIQLPHTVYLYQKKPLPQDDIRVTATTYSASRHKLICEMTNIGTSLGRARAAQASGPHGGSATLAGFPLLPGMTRRLELDWTSKDPPTSLQVSFDHFTLKPAIVEEADPGIAPAARPAAGMSIVESVPPPAPISPLPQPPAPVVAGR